MTTASSKLRGYTILPKYSLASLFFTHHIFSAQRTAPHDYDPYATIATMDPANDLRNVYGPSAEFAAIKSALQSHPPPRSPAPDDPSDPDAAALCALDCLVAVIRRIYSFHIPVFSKLDETTTTFETWNPLLRYAWQAFTPDKEHTDAERERMKKALLERLRLGNGSQKLSTFEELVDCNLMANTMWSRSYLLLYCDPTVQTNNSLCTYEWDSSEATQRSLLRFDRRQIPELSFQQFIDKSFGLLPFREANALFIPTPPTIVRLLYTTTQDKEPLSFESLRSFSMPVGDWVPMYDPATGKKIANRFDGAVTRRRYILLAVVTLADEKNLRREDRVRTYALTGQQLIPDPAVPVFQGLWSLEEKGPRRYMMFYGDVDSMDPHGDHPEMELP
ncbi:hypothetical protein CEP54_009262 [Fusarium duplospermum]|uniref:Uncharacterized protein n=1 Tax=Fusarium duplospermum TaxID=1325734 RepID=A0A428PRG1_9HYPO|nr:hypothetical protein CEP54_009262 [Fusarium duplospermum]